MNTPSPCLLPCWKEPELAIFSLTKVGALLLKGHLSDAVLEIVQPVALIAVASFVVVGALAAAQPVTEVPFVDVVVDIEGAGLSCEVSGGGFFLASGQVYESVGAFVVVSHFITTSDLQSGLFKELLHIEALEHLMVLMHAMLVAQHVQVVAQVLLDVGLPVLVLDLLHQLEVPLYYVLYLLDEFGSAHLELLLGLTGL